jgi:hypothetical protein
MSKRFKPQYLPYNYDARALVQTLAAELGLSLKGKTGAKHRAILSSFLFYAQSSDADTMITWSGGTTSQDTTGFSFFPASGALTIKAVRTKLVQASYLTEFDDLPSGLGNMSIKEAKVVTGTDNKERIKQPKSYRLNATTPLFSNPQFVSALFVDAQRPYVMVDKPEEYTDKVKRKAAGIKAPKLSWKVVYEGKQKRRATTAAKPVKAMNAFWAKHPLVLPATNTDRAQHFACGTRIFHNGSLISGGRWYGGWTNIKSHKRLHMRIDDEPICEIDLNASQPTLFSALHGIRMNVVGNTWTNVYASVVERLSAGEEPKLLRMMVKQVLVEMLGSGSYKRTGPASTDAQKKPLDFDDVQLFFNTDYSKKMYQQIQSKALEVFPALKKLDTKYLNTSGFLSYHESEILTLTLLKLKALSVVAYGVHDCVIVKQSDKDVAVETYRDIIRNYCLKHQRSNNYPSLGINVAITIEEKHTDKVKLEGSYD